MSLTPAERTVHVPVEVRRITIVERKTTSKDRTVKVE